jgi:hypothetical protein
MVPNSTVYTQMPLPRPVLYIYKCVYPGPYCIYTNASTSASTVYTQMPLPRPVLYIHKCLYLGPYCIYTNENSKQPHHCFIPCILKELFIFYVTHLLDAIRVDIYKLNWAPNMHAALTDLIPMKA